MDEPPSSPPQDIADSPEKALAYYKAQYEQLESELAEFQESSKELEAELEKDVEQAEQRERKLKEKAESLEFEVDEWKSKYKQAKVEANAAQNTLQKEITTLRDENRTFMLQLRDIEVQNDDFERQARNTSSSLEDMESKLNVAIERNVMMEEDIKVGEQEREALRIETQRLREELSDLKIEAEIMQDKLRKRQLQPLETDITAPNTPSMDSPSSVASSPMITTPPDTKSVSTNDTVSETPTPPSPPMSEASVTTKGSLLKTPMNPPSKLKMPSGDSSTTPKPSRRNPTPSFRSSQGPSVPVRSTNASRGRNATPSVIRNAKAKAPATRGLPNSNSLTHIRTLTAQMQRLEQRVHSARSKLPAPITTPPRASPRSSSSMAGTYMPPSVTIRSRKRTAGSTASSTSFAEDGDETPASSKHVPRLSTSGISRLSFGPLPTRDGDSRPSSRASATSYTRPDRPLSRTATDRPASRTSMSGARTPLGHYSQSSIAESRRPRSSIGGNFGASHGHGHSQSVTNIGDIGDLDDKDTGLATPSRRSTFSKHDLDGVGSAIPLPASASGSGLPRRKSGGGPVSSQPRRSTSGAGLRDVLETEESTQATGRPRKLTDVGETY